MKILVFGSLNIDRTYALDHFVQPGETTNSLSLTVGNGGKGLNQAVACKKAGSDVYMAGKVGADGLFLVDALKKYEVNTDLVIVEPNELTGHAVIQLDKNGQNNIILYGGTNRTITKENVDEVLSHFEKGDVLLLQNEISCLDYIIDKGHEMGMLVALNPSPMDDALLACDMSKVSFFIMNEIEAKAICGYDDADKAIEVLHEKYPDAKIVITLGGDGAKYFDGEKTYQHGIFKVKAVDTTAAGDTFTGYFLNGMLTGMRPMDIMAMSSKASAITVSRHGAADSIPTRAEVQATELELK